MSYGQGHDYSMNPYQASGMPPASGGPPFNKAKLLAPAIALIVVGALAVLSSILGLVNALLAGPPDIPPDAPPMMQEFLKGSVGPMAAVIQGVFLVTGLIILAGSIQMVRVRSWPMALAASIVSMIQLGSCCCFIGLPIGIWSLVILLQQDVKAAFQRNG